jgi:hypothetical protein
MNESKRSLVGKKAPQKTFVNLNRAFGTFVTLGQKFFAELASRWWRGNAATAESGRPIWFKKATTCL